MHVRKGKYIQNSSWISRWEQTTRGLCAI